MEYKIWREGWDLGGSDSEQEGLSLFQQHGAADEELASDQEAYLKEFEPHLAAMQDAYGEEEGNERFKEVVSDPAKYGHDSRRLVKQLAKKCLAKQDQTYPESRAADQGLIKAALIAMFDATCGRQWTSKEPGWSRRDRGRNITDWLGVEVGKSRQIERLKLINNNLCGDVQDVLERLGSLDMLGGVVQLRELNFASNSLGGELPENVWRHFGRCCR